MLVSWKWKLEKLSATVSGQSLQRNLRILNLTYSYADVGSSVHLLFLKSDKAHGSSYTEEEILLKQVWKNVISGIPVGDALLLYVIKYYS